MNWFSKLTGINEENSSSVRSFLEVDGSYLVSKANSKRFEIGHLSMPSLSELRSHDYCAGNTKTTVCETVGNVQELHQQPENAGALFQVASQFNLLEMISPSMTPKHGVGVYEDDLTQGPACAIACGAGTIFRNYFVPLAGRIGQTDGKQIDCLADIACALGNENDAFWSMENGYALPVRGGLEALNRKLDILTERERDELRGLLRVGLLQNSEVTLGQSGNRVSQVYCSALPVAYGRDVSALWKSFACLILEAAYEATFRAAVLNFEATGNNRLYLTLLGGGAFGNKPEWISDAIQRSLLLFSDRSLDVRIVSFGQSSPVVSQIVAYWARGEESVSGGDIS